MAREKNRWTDEEIEILKAYYPIEGSDVHRRVNHSPASCRTRAGLLGIHIYETKGSRKNWTEREDEIIRTHYPTCGTAITDRLPTRTKHDIVARAIYLSVKCDKTPK